MKTSVPSWLTRSETISYEPSRPTRKGHLRKTLLGVISFLQRHFENEELSRKSGLLQLVHPISRVWSVLICLVALSFTHDPVTLGVWCVAVAILCGMSSIPLKIYFGRVWPVAFFFTGLVSLPATLNVFVPGEPLVTLWRFKDPVQLWQGVPLETLSLTGEGVETFLRLFLRSAASLGLVVALTLTTSWAEIMRSLRRVGIPPIFVLVLAMTYRYLFVLLRTVEEFVLAKAARSLGRSGGADERRWAAGRIGFLLRKSLHQAQEIHTAMTARGFTSEFRTLRARSLRWKDAVPLIGSVCVLLFTWIR